MRFFSIFNDLIFKELRLHLEFVENMYGFLKDGCLDIDKSLVERIVKSVVDLEKEFGPKLDFCQVFGTWESSINSHIEYWDNQICLESVLQCVLHNFNSKSTLVWRHCTRKKGKDEKNNLIKDDQQEDRIGAGNDNLIL